MECPACLASLPDEALFCLRCGARAPDRSRAEPEDPIRAALRKALGQQYEIQHLLGKGGMGAVYLATEAALEREVAIKVLPPDRGATKESRDRFRREARTAAKLSHPNIVPLYTFGDVDGTLYFVMGYVKGESLAARLKREGQIPVEESRRILIELCDALDYAHKLGVIHRDIKPDNVLIEEGTGRALLTDFGVAKALGAGQTLTEAGSVLGTPHYMSPEQAQGKADVDSRSDLYSLGVMGYAMLAGRLPFEGATPGDVMVQHITKEAPALRTVAPEIPPELAGALMRCLEKSPVKRWPDAKALRESIVAKDDREIPDDMVGLRRDIQFTAFVLYASALVAFRSTTQIPDPEAFEVPWETLYILTSFLSLGVMYSMWLRHREGRPWREILGFAFSKPGWWVGWYPARLRLRGDVWLRLPPDLRRARKALWGFLALWVLFFPAQMIYFAGLDPYVKKGIKNPAQLFFERVPRGVSRPLILSLGPTMLGLMVTALVSAARWGRSSAVARTSRHKTNAMFLRDTAHPTFWEKPETASLLLPADPAGSHDAVAPTSAPELARTIAEVCRSQPSGTGVENDAASAARALASSIAVLDAEIALLASNVDAAERGRLEAKLVALGPAPSDEGEARGQMRELLQKQLELLRGFETRLAGLKAGRDKRFELLRALWLQSVDLRGATNDPNNGAAARIGELCAEITRHLDGAGPLPTAAISDAPTIERS